MHFKSKILKIFGKTEQPLNTLRTSTHSTFLNILYYYYYYYYYILLLYYYYIIILLLLLLLLFIIIIICYDQNV